MPACFGAFAISLSGNGDRADDLVQETLLRAIANIDSFQPGSNLPAWLFTILRNLFHSEYRKRRREVEDPDVDLLTTMVNLLRNAFVAAFSHSLDGSITLRDVATDVRALTRLLAELHDKTLRARMVPLGTLAVQLRRAVRDVVCEVSVMG